MFKKRCKQNVLYLTIVALCILSGCFEKQQYYNHHMLSLTPHINFKSTKQNITLRAKRFNKQNCIQLFGSRGKKLITHRHKSSIYPIQLSITNKSNNTLLLEDNNINIPIMKYNKVARRMQHSTTIRAMGLLASGIALATITALGGFTIIGIGIITATAPLAIIGAVACASAPFMLLVGTPVSTTVNSVKNLRVNTNIKKDIKNKSLVRNVIIKPGQKIDTLIFVKGQNYRNKFRLKLYNQENPQEMVIFNVTL